MGNWNINIQGIGAHHNNNPEVDSDIAARNFVQLLLDLGQTVESATFTSGGKTNLMPECCGEDCGCHKKYIY